jgi:hypothetical protein
MSTERKEENSETDDNKTRITLAAISGAVIVIVSMSAGAVIIGCTYFIMLHANEWAGKTSTVTLIASVNAVVNYSVVAACGVYAFKQRAGRLKDREIHMREMLTLKEIASNSLKEQLIGEENRSKGKGAGT